jgi:phenylpyruvate tautomerase PptA (4-oxalocrotonate tautomerase family)
MPFIQISLVEGKSPEYIQAIADGVHEALQKSWGILKDDRFQIISEHKKSHFIFNKMMWEGNRSDDVIAIHITSILRTKEMKLNFYRELVNVLTSNPGVRKEDIFVTIVHNEPENWSFGKGAAQLLK